MTPFVVYLTKGEKYAAELSENRLEKFGEV